jgi:hypothetical protein
MKLPPSALLIKLFSDLPLVSRRSPTGGKVLLGSLVVLSVIITVSYFPAMELPSMNLAAATPATSNLPLFGNPTSQDFMSYAVAIMPTVPGANLNTSNVAGSTNCDLLVPVTYIDAGCMNSLPLLFPFNEPQQTNITEPINQTFYNNYNNSSALDLSIGVASDNITAGDTQTVTVSVSDQNSTQPIPGALVLANVTDSSNSLLHEYSGTTDEVGQVSFPFVIPADAAADIYTVSVLASADGYENASASTTFDVIGSGDFFDNSTSDNFSDGSSSSDNCCSSSDSSSSSNDDFTSPTVKSTNPGLNDQNVPTDTKTITVTFSEKMDGNSIDTFDLTLDGDNTIFQNVDIQSVKVSGKTATFTINGLLPGTNYLATISSDVQDQNGNFLDCFNSKGVNDSCEWDFDTGGSTTSPVVTASPKTGLYNTDQFVTLTSSQTNTDIFYTTNGNDPTTSSTPYTGTPIAITSTTTLKFFGVNAAGNSGATVTETYTIDKTAPTVVPGSENPKDGANDVATNSNLNVTFSEVMSSSSLQSNFFVRADGSSTNIPGTVSLSSNGKTAIFDPLNLNISTTYIANITTGVTDLAGNHLPESFIWSFETAAQAFSIASTAKLSNNSIAPGTNQSNATLVLPLNNKSNASAPVVANSTFNTAGSNGTISLHSNAPPVNTSSSQAIENTSISPTAKELNNTSLIASTDNKINNNPPSTTSTQNNDTSNSKISSEKSMTISQPESKDQFNPTELTKDNTTHDKASSVIQDKNIIDAKHEPSQNKLTSLRSENKSDTSDANSQNPQILPTKDSVTEKTIQHKTITKVKSTNSDNQPDKQSRSSDSIKRDRALFFKYLNSNRDNANDKTLSKDIVEVNNRPIAINDEATTESNNPVKINILSNDKDADGDKLSVMGVSRPVRGTIESDADGTITYSPLRSWSGTERFGYTINDGRGGVATGTVTVIVQNQPPEAEDQDVSVNANSPIKIKLEAKDPDDDKLKFVLVTKPSHGRIAQFSTSTGTLAYIPDANYDGKDEFTFKVHDGTEFSKDAKVSIKIEKNEKSSRDQVQQNDKQQPNKEQSDQSPTDEKSKNDTPPHNSDQQPTSSTQDTEQQKNDQKTEEQQSDQADKPTSDTDTTGSGDTQPTTNS